MPYTDHDLKRLKDRDRHATQLAEATAAPMPLVPRSELKQIERNRRTSQREAKAARQRRYYAANTEKVNARTNGWRGKNPERVNARARARYATVPADLREELSLIKTEDYAAWREKFPGPTPAQQAECKEAIKKKKLEQRARDLGLFLNPGALKHSPDGRY